MDSISHTTERWTCKWRIDYFYCFRFPRVRKKMLQWTEEWTWNIYQNLLINQYSQLQQQMCQAISRETLHTAHDLWTLQWVSMFLPSGIWRSAFLLMNKTSEKSALCHLHARCARSLRRERQQQQADTFKVFLRIKKIPSSSDREEIFWHKVVSLSVHISEIQQEIWHALSPSLLLLSFFSNLHNHCALCLINSFLSAATGKQVNKNTLQSSCIILTSLNTQSGLEKHGGEEEHKQGGKKGRSRKKGGQEKWVDRRRDR